MKNLARFLIVHLIILTLVGIESAQSVSSGISNKQSGDMVHIAPVAYEGPEFVVSIFAFFGANGGIARYTPVGSPEYQALNPKFDLGRLLNLFEPTVPVEGWEADDEFATFQGIVRNPVTSGLNAGQYFSPNFPMWAVDRDFPRMCAGIAAVFFLDDVTGSPFGGLIAATQFPPEQPIYWSPADPTVQAYLSQINHPSEVEDMCTNGVWALDSQGQDHHFSPVIQSLNTPEDRYLHALCKATSWRARNLTTHPLNSVIAQTYGQAPGAEVSGPQNMCYSPYFETH